MNNSIDDMHNDDDPPEPRPHIKEGKFQSDKYPTCPPGKVPLSVDDLTAQDLLWEYAQRRRHVDRAFADDLEFALRQAGYDPNEMMLGAVTAAIDAALGEVHRQGGLFSNIAREARNEGILAARPFLDEIRRRRGK